MAGSAWCDAEHRRRHRLPADGMMRVRTRARMHSSVPQVTPPDSVPVSAAGLSLPMLLVGGEPKTGLTYHTSTELPAGTWTATFTAEVPEGENPAPYELAQPIVVTTPPTPPPPTPGPT